MNKNKPKPSKTNRRTLFRCSKCGKWTIGTRVHNCRPRVKK